MEKIIIKINTTNSAFGEPEHNVQHVEVVRILRELAYKIEEGELHTLSVALRDNNGNNVGIAYTEN